MQLILASSSPYRRQLLQRLNLDFDSFSPNIDEHLHQQLSLKQNVIDIAKRKALAVNKLHKDALIIAGDQLCTINGSVLGKPHTFEKACEQLRMASSQQVIFYSSLVVYNPIAKKFNEHCDETIVVFRDLTDQEIEHYVHHEKPLNCAGSFKVESLGVTLFEKVISEDPTALIGVPLIKLCHFLRKNDIPI